MKLHTGIKKSICFHVGENFSRRDAACYVNRSTQTFYGTISCLCLFLWLRKASGWHMVVVRGALPWRQQLACQGWNMPCGSASELSTFSPNRWVSWPPSISPTPNLSANKQQILKKLFSDFPPGMFLHKIKAMCRNISAWYQHWYFFSVQNKKEQRWPSAPEDLIPEMSQGRLYDPSCFTSDPGGLSPKRSRRWPPSEPWIMGQKQRKLGLGWEKLVPRGTTVGLWLPHWQSAQLV